MNEVAPYMAAAVTAAVSAISLAIGYKLGQHDANRAVEEVTGLDLVPGEHNDSDA